MGQVAKAVHDVQSFKFMNAEQTTQTAPQKPNRFQSIVSFEHQISMRVSILWRKHALLRLVICNYMHKTLVNYISTNYNS